MHISRRSALYTGAAALLSLHANTCEADPLTIAVIATAIAVGILKEAGARIFNEIFPADSSDFRSTLLSALNDVVKILRVSIQEEFIRDYEASGAYPVVPG